jgi:aspartate/methionine/tyrosine aminotransferase
VSDTGVVDFPYMLFARREALAAAFPLTQSGMPPADARLLEGAPLADLAFAGVDALPKLQAALAALIGVPHERLAVALGASGAMNVVASALFGPGNRVAVETPSYEPLRALPRRLGAEVRTIERRPERAWRVDPGEVERALAGAPRGHVFLTNPHNPSGALTAPGELVELARIAERAGGLLISNEIYMEYAPPARRYHACRLAPNAISLGSLTKAYGLGALRIGWIALGESAAKERSRIDDATYLAWVDPPTPAVRAALAAIERIAELRAAIERVERESRPIFASWLASEPAVSAHLPEFGLIAFPRIEGASETRELARYLAAEHGVGVVPGEFFGLPGHVRLGFGLPPPRLTEALRRLSAGLAARPRS